jgi:hypothetical protein
LPPDPLAGLTLFMDYLRGPLYLDVAASALCLGGVLLMIFTRGGWFIVGVATVVLGVLLRGWAFIVMRKLRHVRGQWRSGDTGQ